MPTNQTPSTAFAAIDHDAARNANLAYNLDFLAAQTKEASNGFFTITADEHYRRFSLVRTDGKALGSYRAFTADGERPIAGIQLDLYVPSYKHLTRRNRQTLQALLASIRTIIWSGDRFDAEYYLAARTDIGKVAWDAGDHDEARFSRFLQALSAFERKNRLSY